MNTPILGARLVASGLLATIALAAPVSAQQALALAATAMPGMDMTHGATVARPVGKRLALMPPAAPVAASSSMRAMSKMDMGSMRGMEMARGTPAAEPGGTSTSAPAAPVLPPGPVDPAANLAKLEAMPMTGMDMADNRRFGKVVINQFEATCADRLAGQAWDAYAWYGSDFDRLLLRSEGARSAGHLYEGDIEALWSHAGSAFWDTTLGVRHDFGVGQRRNWAAFGVQGLAPYWFDIEATGYVGTGGRTAARFKAEYELRFTQRLILQPEFEANLYGRSDPVGRLGSGLSDASLGLRLRYEIRREFAPYVGVVWQRVFGGTADFRHAENKSVFEQQIIAGVRTWF